MPDYLRPIRFGTFLTPANEPPERAAQLAQLSEQVGFDLVTYQDHPYQAGFHDTWTLLTWVAASTERITVAGNVLNLPLRQPAVLARAAASLDLLSGGRLSLGLGAGAFWDPIAAMGGPRRTPAEGVTALREAVEIIRGLWDLDNRAPLRVSGDFYSVDGAARGPKPAHEIPIWLGAYRPRMLRMTGEIADGWLPSLAYLQPRALAEGNKRIDDAAEAAGRAPSEIERLLNFGGGNWSLDRETEQLSELALTEGVSTFILMSDDPNRLAQFAQEVAPAVREAVAAERRARGTTESSGRSATAVAARAPEIDYDAIPQSLRATAIEPGDFAFGGARNTYLRGGNPGLILRPADTEQVVDAVTYAATQTLPLGLRSGGHGISGRSTNDGGIIIDLGAIDHIEVVDPENGRVRIGPGARWMQVAQALDPYGLALSSGDYGGVGVGGLATAGGVGWLVREHGLTIDHVRSATVVLADGSVVTASDEEHPEIFWALRGAGANIGAVVEFEFEADTVGDIGHASFTVAVEDRADFFTRWGAAIEQAPRDTTSFVILGASRPGQPDTAQVMLVVDAGDEPTVRERLDPFLALGDLLGGEATITRYAGVMSNASGAPHRGQGQPTTRSGLLRAMTPEFARAAAELLGTGLVYFFQVRSLGGAVADIPADATAFAHRDAQYSIAAFGASGQVDAAWERLEEQFDGLYLSFETRLGEDILERAFPPATLARLREIKREVDPTGLFSDNFGLGLASGDGYTTG